MFPCLLLKSWISVFRPICVSAILIIHFFWVSLLYKSVLRWFSSLLFSKFQRHISNWQWHHYSPTTDCLHTALTATYQMTSPLGSLDERVHMKPKSLPPSTCSFYHLLSSHHCSPPYFLKSSPKLSLSLSMSSWLSVYPLQPPPQSIVSTLGPTLKHSLDLECPPNLLY